MISKKNIIYSSIYLFLSIAAILVLVFTKITPSKPSSAAVPQQEFMTARVEKVKPTDTFQTMTVRILDGKDKGRVQDVFYDPQHVKENILKTGDSVVLTKQTDSRKETSYVVTDRYRIPQILTIFAIFFLFVFCIAGWKGFGSIFGLIVSVTVIYAYVLPNVLSGKDPLTICLIGAIVIILISTYAAHGFSRQTTVALLSTLLSLFITYFIAKVVVGFSLLSGFGSEDAYNLHFGEQQLIDMRGLLLGGVIIATVGALNDVTTTQAAAIFHLVKANKNLSFGQVFTDGFSIGREHVISLVNTLVLAYVGSSLAIFIILFYNPLNQPYWTMLNSEVISEEVIKTIAGTFGLVLSMPIVTFLSAIVCSEEVKKNIKILARSLWS